MTNLPLLVLAMLAATAVSGFAQTDTYPRVIAKGMVTPKILCVEIQDATVIHETDYDLFSGRRLDRDDLDDKTTYALTRSNGPAPAIANVWRKSKPWGVSRRETALSEAADGLDDKIRSPFRHQMFFELDRAIQPGENLTITFADAAIGPVNVNFAEKELRSPTIHSNQIGWRPADTVKRAYLSFWRPTNANYGIYDIAKDFPNNTIPNYQIINATTGATVGVSGPVTLNQSPYEVDATGQPDWYETRPNGSGEVFYAYDPTALYNIGSPLPNVDHWTRRDAAGTPTEVRMNPAKTFVYQIDFSQLSTPGTYKIWIPGLGVSYPFVVGNDVWHEVASVTLGGVYNHRKGTALDGWRHGYERPRGIHPADGTVFELVSTPHIFCEEGPIGGFARTNINEPYDGYRTGGTIATAWGGYMDAGDWDNRVQHTEISYLLFDLYEMMPAYFDAAANQFDLPDSAAVLPDPIAGGSHDYANLPGIVDEAVWGVDFFRRNQITSGADKGAVYTAVEHAHFSSLPASWVAAGNNSYVFAPDPYSTYLYAAVAAKAAVVLGKFSPALQNLYRTSATDAYNWAEAHAWNGGIYTNGSGSSVNDGLMQWLADWYAAHEFASDPTLIAPELTNARGKIAEKMIEARFAAAAGLYRVTGIATYREVAEATSSIPADKSSNELGGWYLNGNWEFFLTGDPDSALVPKVATSLIETADTRFVDPALFRYAYGNTRHNWTQLDWGSGVQPSMQSTSMLRAALVDPGFIANYVGAMDTGLSFVLGGNQINTSLTTGLGQNSVEWALHTDSGRGGFMPPPGITVYGFSRSEKYTFNRWGSLFNAQPWSDLYDKFYYDSAAAYEPSRAIYPEKTTYPAWENFIEVPGMVHHTEYTVQQMIPMFAFASFLDSLKGGNVAPAVPPAGYSNVPNFGAPDSGGPVVLMIEAEDYVGFYDTSGGNQGGVYRSDNVDIQVSTDAGGGYQVGWITAGEWLEYDLGTAAGGTADFVFRVATPKTRKTLQVAINGLTVATVAIPPTGGWQTFKDVALDGVALPASGPMTLRVTAPQGSFNFNWLRATITPASGSGSGVSAIDLSALPMQSYSDQDVNGTTTLSGNGKSVTLTGNNWKSFRYSYTVTPNTVLECNVSAVDAGELIGIGLDQDNNHSNGARVFVVGGSQNTPSNMINAKGPLGPIKINVGQFYTGPINYIGLAADDDADSSTNVTFSDIRIYEK